MKIRDVPLRTIARKISLVDEEVRREIRVDGKSLTEMRMRILMESPEVQSMTVEDYCIERDFDLSDYWLNMEIRT